MKCKCRKRMAYLECCPLERALQHEISLEAIGQRDSSSLTRGGGEESGGGKESGGGEGEWWGGKERGGGGGR